MHDKPQTFRTVVDKTSVHRQVLHGVAICVRSIEFTTGVSVTNLGGNMARSTQFPSMITRSTIIYEIISPGAAGSSIYVQYGSNM